MASSAHIIDTERACTTGKKRNEYECIYLKEGKLPQKPFEIRYLVAPMTPMLPPGYDPHFSGLKLVDYMWQVRLGDRSEEHSDGFVNNDDRNLTNPLLMQLFPRLALLLARHSMPNPVRLSRSSSQLTSTLL